MKLMFPYSTEQKEILFYGTYGWFNVQLLIKVKLSLCMPSRHTVGADVQLHSILTFNPLNTELNTICYLLALLAHNFLHVRRMRVKSLTLRLLMSYIYGAPILDVSRSHTTTQPSQ
jgi:hypothetical protein